MVRGPRSRAYCFTLNNYTEEEYDSILGIECEYLIVGKEVGAEGTPHLQGYVRFRTQRAFNTVKASLSNRCHLEKAIGSPDQNIKYCSKDGNFEEVGERPKGQGAREDLKDLQNQIKAGKSVAELMDEDPYFYHAYGRTMEKLEDREQSRKYRDWQTEGLWYWGATGEGKTHMAMEGYSPETHYLWRKDNGWWDLYQGQDIVVMNDFRGEIPYNEMLQLVDKWPFTVPRRSRQPTPFLGRRVIITSSLPPEKVYKKRAAEDSIAQLDRRFLVYEVKDRVATLDQDVMSRASEVSEVLRGNTSSEQDLSRWD